MKDIKTNFQIAKLISKKLNGDISAKEEVLLEDWLLQSPENADLMNRLLDKGYQEKGIAKIEELDYESAWNKISAEIGVDERSKPILLKYAAIFIPFVIAIGCWVYFNHTVPSRAKIASHQVKQDQPIHPGTQQAILELSNGNRVALNGKTNAIKEGGNVTINNKNHILNYHTADIADHTDIVYNKIITPRGGEYQLVLADGTKVWLNASSSLRYPVKFTGHDRVVSLTGEGYFEVAKDKNKPFKVKFNDQEVEVLGTHFNINAYEDEPETKATLLEGSVKISKNNIKQLLLPGQQALSNSTSAGFTVRQANLQEVVAWKDGFFLFRNTSIQNIMKQAARWYDIDVVYESGNLEEKEFGGRTSRFKNISELLKNLEYTGTIHFKVEGRRVTVMQ